MKYIVIASFIIASTFSTSSCTNNTGSSTDPGQQISSGTWRVTLFIDSGNDETSDFAGYTFSFNGGNVLTAVKNGVSQNGTWTYSAGSNKFIIDLGPKTAVNKPLGELTDDWKVISNSSTEIRLEDDNPASNEFVTFTKN